MQNNSTTEVHDSSGFDVLGVCEVFRMCIRDV